MKIAHFVLNPTNYLFFWNKKIDSTDYNDIALQEYFLNFADPVI